MKITNYLFLSILIISLLLGCKKEEKPKEEPATEVTAEGLCVSEEYKFKTIFPVAPTEFEEREILKGFFVKVFRCYKNKYTYLVIASRLAPTYMEIYERNNEDLALVFRDINIRNFNVVLAENSTFDFEYEEQKAFYYQGSNGRKFMTAANIAKDNYVYQVIMMKNSSAVPDSLFATFFRSLDFLE